MIDSQPYEDFAFTMRAELDSVWLTAHMAWPHHCVSPGMIDTDGSRSNLLSRNTRCVESRNTSRSVG